MPDVYPMLAKIEFGSQVEPLSRPLSIDRVCDGGTYQLQSPPLVLTNLFLKIGRVDELYIKVPSERGMDDYRKFVRTAQFSPQDIRSIEETERFERLTAALEGFPGLKQLTATSAEFAHYLGVHKLQYERLRGQTAVEIPRARFGFLRWEQQGLRRADEPVLFQERVRGTTLWSMFDFAAGRVLPRWQDFLPAISVQLSELLEGGLTNHIDWNIKNFVFDETEERLFYVDLKPTIFVAKHSNEQNLSGIRQYFLA